MDEFVHGSAVAQASNAATDGDMQTIAAGEDDRIAIDRSDDAVADFLRHVPIRRREQHDELITAKSTDSIAIAHLTRNALSNFA